MRIIIVIIPVLFLFSCKQGPEPLDPTNQNADPCLNERNVFNTISTFKQVDTILPVKDFNRIINYLESKGDMRLDRQGDSQGIYNGTDVSFKHEIRCASKGYVRQTFILKNVARSACNFKSTIAIIDPEVCSEPCHPQFYFEQISFADNSDRDSALKIITWVFSNLTVDSKNQVTMDYYNKYAQTVIGNKRIYVLMSGFQPYEPTLTAYADYVRQYLKESNLN